MSLSHFHVVLPQCQQGLATAGQSWLRSIRKSRNAVYRQRRLDRFEHAELFAVAKHPIWRIDTSLLAAAHIIPVHWAEGRTPGQEADEYYLGFLEYQENGDPTRLFKTAQRATSRVSIDFLEKDHSGKEPKPTIDQLDVLRRHLATRSNYVIAFVHGWRHDASIGDQNVAICVIPAHAARFFCRKVRERKSLCDMRSPIYIGCAWGDESQREWHEDRFGVIGEYSGILQLPPAFRRKPVSEQVAPGAISALRTIESVLSARNVDGT